MSVDAVDARPPARRHDPVLLIRGPVIVAVLAATAIPFELHWPPHLWSLSVPPIAELVANVVGYLPVGFVLAPIGMLRGVAAAVLLSVVAEAAQTVIVHRDPSAFDALANAFGGLLGLLIARAVPIALTSIRISISRAIAALAAAAALAWLVWSTSGYPINPRGVTEPGTLEAHWTLDDAEDHPSVPGMLGTAALFTGPHAAIDFGQATSFRLVGSMTVSAWIRPASFPINDAAIVSTLNHVPRFALGWQLDTTVDRGPRTIAFKVADECGDLVARYGATTLRTGTWYHVAGVYDAERESMHVYLNGAPDDGFLLGSVGGTHRSSRQPVWVGGRSDRRGFEFAGAIDDVRVYSFALTEAQIAAIMRGNAAAAPARPVRYAPTAGRRGCHWMSEPADARMSGMIATIGALAAVACAGLLPALGGLGVLAASALAGLGLVPLTAPTLPAAKFWIIPLTSTAGGIAVLTSLLRGPATPESSEAHPSATVGDGIKDA